jgi:hypothetical protein
MAGAAQAVPACSRPSPRKIPAAPNGRGRNLDRIAGTTTMITMPSSDNAARIIKSRLSNHPIAGHPERIVV